jgi:hypothetical protein
MRHPAKDRSLLAFHPYLWSNSGFFYEGTGDQSSTIAYDMRGAFEPYSVAEIAGNECLIRLDALDGSAAFVVSGWLPGTRFSPDAPPPGSAWEAYRNYSYLTYAELLAYAVVKGSYPFVGRYPLTEPSMGWRLLIGSKLALVGDGALILAAPP